MFDFFIVYFPFFLLAFVNSPPWEIGSSPSLRYFAKFGGALRGKWLRQVKIVEALKRLLAKAFGVETD
jgi:hypothetical protein